LEIFYANCQTRQETKRLDVYLRMCEEFEIFRFCLAEQTRINQSTKKEGKSEDPLKGSAARFSKIDNFWHHHLLCTTYRVKKEHQQLPTSSIPCRALENLARNLNFIV
jgi:hypothetical protein